MMYFGKDKTEPQNQPFFAPSRQGVPYLRLRGCTKQAKYTHQILLHIRAPISLC